MKQKFIWIFVILIMLINMAIIVMADNPAISITIDNKEIEFTSDSGFPFVDANGRTLVPVRAVMEAYGCKVIWDSENHSAIIYNAQTEVIVPVGKSYIIVDGKNIAMDTSAVIVESRTYLPIRAVLEAFGADVEWNNGKITITSNDNDSFENICIDSNGDILFELANGETIILGNINENNAPVSVVDAEINASGNLIISLSDGKNINAGSVISYGRNGEDGKDGVSVIDASITYYGDLIIRLSDGETINAGNVKSTGGQNGQITQNGKDGVSVTDAYVDRNGDLIIVLSNNKSINAGNVKSSGSSVSQLTFEDYPVGTKFYLTMPTGQFDVPVKVDGMSYTVHVENIYYELSGKYDADDAEAWIIEDGRTTFAPYVLTFYAECSTDDDLAGAVIDIGIRYGTSTITISGKADHNGTLIAERTYNTMPTPPSDVCFYKITIVPAADYSACVGKWVSFSNDTLRYFTVNTDGTITLNGITYTATYSETNNGKRIIANLPNDETWIFDFVNNPPRASASGDVYFPELKDISSIVGNWYSTGDSAIAPTNLRLVLTVADDGSFVYNGTTYYPIIFEDPYNIIASTDEYTFEFDMHTFNAPCLSIYGSDNNPIQILYPETKDISHLTGKYHNDNGTIIVNADGSIVYDGITYPIAVVEYDAVMVYGYYAQIQVGSENILLRFDDNALRVNGDIYYKEISDISMIVGDWHAQDLNGDGIYPSVTTITVNSDGTIVYGDITYDAIYTCGDFTDIIIAYTGSMSLIFLYENPFMQIAGDIDGYSKT